MRKLLLSLLIILNLGVMSLVGCEQDDVTPENTGVVEATGAYLRYYGDPPQGKAGRAFATVGYLPTKDNLSKIGPLPIFLFTQEGQMKKVLDKLISGDLITSDKQPYENVYPDDLEIHARPIREGTLTLELVTSRQWEDELLRSGAVALMETALQFDDVQAVKVTLNGAPLPWIPDSGYQQQLDLIIDIPPPTLIFIAGTWENGHASPEELLIEFDRPVKINGFELYHPDGRKVEGEYFISIFQMAVVVHPHSPELFQEGGFLRAEWNVADDLGRTNSGIDTMQIKRLDH